MTLVEFSRERGRRPFQPFTLVTVDGQRFTVDHPEFAATDRRGGVVTFYGSDNTRHEIDGRGSSPRSSRSTWWRNRRRHPPATATDATVLYPVATAYYPRGNVAPYSHPELRQWLSVKLSDGARLARSPPCMLGMGGQR